MSNPDLSALAEQLQRIEHKLDLVIAGLAIVSPTMDLKAVGDLEHVCPLCLQMVGYVTDVFKGHIIRQCGCNSGLSISINPFTLNPPEQKKEQKNDGTSNE